MSQKMMSPNTTLVWVPESGVANYQSPTATELNAGTNFSCAVVRGYTLGSTASDTDTTASICDEGNVENRTYANYEGSLTIFRDVNSADISSVFNIAWALWRRPGARGWIYRRVGKKSNITFSVGDEVEGFLFENDYARTVDGGDNGGPIQATIPFLQQGKVSGAVYVGPLTAPVVTSLTPTSAVSASPGQVITVTGTGFLGVYSVKVGGVAAAAPIVVSATTLSFNTPPGVPTGSQDVIVTNAAGVSSVVAGDKITFS